MIANLSGYVLLNKKFFLPIIIYSVLKHLPKRFWTFWKSWTVMISNVILDTPISKWSPFSIHISPSYKFTQFTPSEISWYYFCNTKFKTACCNRFQFIYIYYDVKENNQVVADLTKRQNKGRMDKRQWDEWGNPTNVSYHRLTKGVLTGTYWQSSVTSLNI